MADQDNKNELLAELLSKFKDLDTEDLLQGLFAAKEVKKRKDEPKEESKVIGEKTRILDRDDVCIYQDLRTKKKGWYISIYEPKYRKRYVKSLKTSNKILAMAEAERIYAERKGRLSVGARPTSITAKELVKKYQNHRRSELTDIPQMGITPKSFDRLCGQIKHWENYVQLQGHTNTVIENIPTEIGKNFALYIKGLRKDNDLKKPRRSNQTINQTVAAVKKMYKFAIEQKYATVVEVPTFTYLKVGRETAPTRDVLREEEKNAIVHWMKYKYPNEKGITKKEKIKRRIFNQAFQLMYLTGCRTSELIKMKWCDISDQRTGSEWERKVNKVINIPQENSKTGRSRNVVAPIKENLDILKKWYREQPFEFAPKPDNYVFPRMTLTDIENNIPTTIVAWNKRLKHILKGSEDAGVWDSGGRRITLYSSRHYWITDAIMRGLTMNDIAMNCGTSITYVESTYSKVTTEMRASQITQGLGIHSLSEESKRRYMDKPDKK